MVVSQGDCTGILSKVTPVAAEEVVNYLCDEFSRGWKLGRVEIGREGCEMTFFSGLWGPTCAPARAVPAELLRRLCSPRIPGLPLSRSVLRWRTFREVERAGERKDAAVRALSAGNAASGQRAALPLCRSLLPGCCWAASSQQPFPSRRKALLTSAPAIAA